MIFHDDYADVPEDDTPHLGLYPFVVAAGAIDLHLVRADEQVVDLRTRPRCVFEVDEVLAVIPSYWVHADYAGSATAYHRTVIFECAASVWDEPGAVAAQQVRLLERYQPEGGFRALATDDPLYARALAQLAAVKLEVTRRRIKFKLGQNRPGATRRRVIEELTRRGRPGDGRAADALQWTIDRGLPRRGR